MQERGQTVPEEKEQSREEWMAEERARLKKGFSYTPKPATAGKPGTGEEVLAGLGLGAGVVGGAIAPHPNPVTFEGCQAATIVNALKSELQDDDTRVQASQDAGAVIVTVLQSQKDNFNQFSPALSVTLIEKADTLTVTLGRLDQSAVRETLGSVGSTLVEQGKRVFTGRRSPGIGGLLETAGSLIEGVQDLAEDVQDLGLPKRVWEIVDRVGKAAEDAHLDQQRRERKAQQEREAAERAWTHCEWCGRAYGKDEGDLTRCPACDGSRGAKPAWLG
jgi:hypothetical protein